MMALDTSAIMAILLNEEQRAACAQALTSDDRIVMSAGTLAEALIVAERRGLGAEIANLIRGLGPEVESVTLATARRVAASYAQWGKGVNPANLNFGDCFAYEIAKTRDCPLLYVGADFARTDIESVL